MVPAHRIRSAISVDQAIAEFIQSAKSAMIWVNLQPMTGFVVVIMGFSALGRYAVRPGLVIDTHHPDQPDLRTGPATGLLARILHLWRDLLHGQLGAVVPRRVRPPDSDDGAARSSLCPNRSPATGSGIDGDLGDAIRASSCGRDRDLGEERDHDSLRQFHDGNAGGGLLRKHSSARRPGLVRDRS
jgi:hypothetical protein